MRKKKKTEAKNLPVLALCAVAVIILLFQVLSLRGKQNEILPEETVAPQGSELLFHPEIIRLEEDECANRLIDIPMVYKEGTMKTISGEEVPDIMSEKIMKSDYRKVVYGSEGSGEEVYMSGPRIVVNNYEIPEAGFYAYYDMYSQETEYFICPACFAKCGLPVNSAISLTCYDDALQQTDHSYAIPVDTLEIHTSWSLVSYNEETNTYYFTVTQNGPFSGLSDVFGSYMGARRYNTMPKDDSVFGYQKVPYSIQNDYWSKLGMSRNALRVRMNRRYETEYEQLSYDQDGGL